MSVSTEKLQNWVKDRDWSLSFGVTLNLKQCRQIVDQTGRSYRISLNDEHIEGTLRHFLNLLNRSMYGNNWRRYNRRIEVLSVREKSSRHHLHLRLKVPITKSTDFSGMKRNSEITDRLLKSIQVCWKKTDWGYGSNYITFCDDGWTDYQMKTRTKSDVLDSILWNNTFLPSLSCRT